MDFFISYNHKDKEFVKSITEIISNSGLKYFLDEKSIKYGDDIENSIFEALSHIPNLLVIISEESLRSYWVPYEIGIVVGKNKYNKIIPILTRPDLELPLYLKKLKYIDSIEKFNEFLTDYITIQIKKKVENKTKLSIYIWKEEETVYALSINSEGARYRYKYKSLGQAETTLKIFENLYDDVLVVHQKPSDDIIEYGWLDVTENENLDDKEFVKWRK